MVDTLYDSKSIIEEQMKLAPTYNFKVPINQLEKYRVALEKNGYVPVPRDEVTVNKQYGTVGLLCQWRCDEEVGGATFKRVVTYYRTRGGFLSANFNVKGWNPLTQISPASKVGA